MVSCPAQGMPGAHLGGCNRVLGGFEAAMYAAADGAGLIPFGHVPQVISQERLLVPQGHQAGRVAVEDGGEEACLLLRAPAISGSPRCICSRQPPAELVKPSDQIERTVQPP